MRKKTVVRVSPEGQVEGFKAVLATDLHDGTPAARQRLLEKTRQHAFERLMLQVIEENVDRPALRLLRQCRVFEI
jgi:uncharacterized iron-regulated protein